MVALNYQTFDLPMQARPPAISPRCPSISPRSRRIAPAISPISRLDLTPQVRKEIADSRSYWDTPTVFKRGFEMDWARIYSERLSSAVLPYKLDQVPRVVVAWPWPDRYPTVP